MMSPKIEFGGDIMSAHPILQPAIVLVLWSLIVLMWMAYTRFSGFAKIRLNLKAAKPGGRGQDLEGVLPDQVNWKSHNYAHLMEQPTLFYAVVAIIALADLPQRHPRHAGMGLCHITYRA